MTRREDGGAMDEAKQRAAAQWLIDGARSAMGPDAVLGELCERLVDGGLPLARVGVFVRTLHPQLLGRSFIWSPGKGVATNTAPAEFVASAEYLASPIARVYDTRRPLRRCLADPECPADFPILAQFRAEGMTDYFATPLFFTDGQVHGATWTTRHPGGFSAADIAAIEAILPPLARVAEVRALWRIAANLLDTYVGHHAGERILAGKIYRGDSERIQAAIWLSDMRGFTTRADRLPPESLIGLLNAYFDCQVPAILAQGGEVLKFMGDGLLAIFDIAGDEGHVEATCARALAAARKAREKVAALGSAGIETEPVRFGLALHLGEVLYGNIGGASRLDFTCIGPAVNLAARLEKLASRLGRDILASEEFAGRCAGELAAIGDFALPGFAEPRRVFGLSEETAAG
jgi:adenylate cyclase